MLNQRRRGPSYVIGVGISWSISSIGARAPIIWRESSSSHGDPNVIVQILRPETTFEYLDDFSNGIAGSFTAPTTGTWP